jgi:methionyl-tRNA formyltransferase
MRERERERERRKYKITFLLDKTNLWFEKQLRSYNFGLNNKYIYKISKNFKNVKNQDVVFPLSYKRILPEEFLNNNKLVLIAHPSQLPKNKGFAPVQYQILRNKRKIYISLIKAVKEVDAGPIAIQDKFYLDGTELSEEIRTKQGLSFLKIIKKFLIKFPKINFKQQIGKGNFNKRRYPRDSKLNINKTIKKQFNHLRINDNENYPSFFEYKSIKYLIKIYKEQN